MNRFSVLLLFAAMMVALGPNAVALDKSIYWSPEVNGLTPTSTKTLEDGTVVTNYPTVRVYKKPNGDFASFVQPKDYRDSNTLEMVSGESQDLKEDAPAIGAFRLTMPDGIIYSIETEPPFDSNFVIRLKDGSGIAAYTSVLKSNWNITEWDLRRYEDFGETSDEETLLNNPLGLTYSDFMNSSPSPSMSNLSQYDYDYSAENNMRLRDRRAHEYMPYYAFFYYKNIDEVTDFKKYDNRLLLLPETFPFFTDYYFRSSDRDGKKYSDGKCFEGDVVQAWKLTANGLVPCGAQGLGTRDIPARDTRHNMSNPHPRFDKDGVIDGEKCERRKVVFTNGDYYDFKTKEYRATLPEGEKIQYFPDVKKNKIVFPNGDIYIGTLWRDTRTDFPSEVFLGQNTVKFDNGTLTMADGKEIKYIGGETEAAIQERKEKEEKERKERYEAAVAKEAAEKAAEQKKEARLIAKYGKANVNALNNNQIKVGMSIQLLKDYGVPLQKDDEGVNYIWYKAVTNITYSGDITYRWLKVNKSTGKIEYIGGARTY